MSLRSTVRPADSFERNLYRGSFDSAVEAVIKAAKEEQGGYACFCNVHLWTTARRRFAVWEALNNASLLFADGAPIAWLYADQVRGQSRRVAGPDLMWSVLDRGRAHEISHFFLGSTPTVLRSLVGRLNRELPDVRIAGFLSPPFGDDQHATHEALIEHIVVTKPHVVWCALGAPRQEEWLARYTHEVAPAFALGVGAAFEFLAGSKPRAPRLMRSAGFEWLHRLGTEPRRLGTRYARTNSQFALDLAKTAFDRARSS